MPTFLFMAPFPVTDYCQPTAGIYSSTANELDHTLKGMIFSLLRLDLPKALLLPIEVLNSMSMTSQCSVGTDLFTFLLKYSTYN